MLAVKPQPKPTTGPPAKKVLGKAKSPMPGPFRFGKTAALPMLSPPGSPGSNPMAQKYLGGMAQLKPGQNPMAKAHSLGQSPPQIPGLDEMPDAPAGGQPPGQPPAGPQSWVQGLFQGGAGGSPKPGGHAAHDLQVAQGGAQPPMSPGASPPSASAQPQPPPAPPQPGGSYAGLPPEEAAFMEQQGAPPSPEQAPSDALYPGVPPQESAFLESQGDIPAGEPAAPENPATAPEAAEPPPGSIQAINQPPGRFQHVIDVAQKGLPGLEAKLQAAQAAGDSYKAKQIQRHIDVANRQVKDLGERQTFGPEEYKGYLSEQGVPGADAAAEKLFQPGGQMDWYQGAANNASAGRPTYAGQSSSSPQLAAQLESSRKLMGSAPAGKTELAGGAPPPVKAAAAFVSGLFTKVAAYGRTDSTLPKVRQPTARTFARERFRYRQRLRLPLPSEPEKAAAFADIGAVIGALRAPHGHRTEGAIRGARRGLYTGAGTMGGALAGLAGGLGAGAAAGLPPDKYMIPLMLGGAGLGALGGGAAGYGLSAEKQAPSWEQDDSESLDPEYRQHLLNYATVLPGFAGAGIGGNVAARISQGMPDPQTQAVVQLLGHGLGGVAGAVGGRYLANKNLQPATPTHDKAAAFVQSLFAKAAHSASCRRAAALRRRRAKSKQADAEDPLLARMMSKGKMDKGKAVAIAKSRGWIRQSGKHLELNSAGRGPRNNAAKHMREEKSAADTFIARLLATSGRQ